MLTFRFDAKAGGEKGEKCVDISLAVEMMDLAHVPHAYDIAVIITGDLDFLPVMQKVRQRGKRVALVSMRNSCSFDLHKDDTQLRDFDVIWLDDHLSDLFVPIESNKSNIGKTRVKSFEFIHLFELFCFSFSLTL